MKDGCSHHGGISWLVKCFMTIQRWGSEAFKVAVIKP